MKIKDLFYFTTGALEALENTDDGTIPLVYGTAENNGIVKFVSVDDDSLIFSTPLITVSYLGTAFVQTIPFTTSVVDKSNIIILNPKKKMSLQELYFYCFQINRHGKFGFNYGRRMNMARLEELNIIEYTKKYDKLLPNVITDKIKPDIEVNLSSNIKLDELVPIENIFRIKNAKSKSIELYDNGPYPFVSNGFYNKGIVKYVTPYETDRIFKGGCISLSAFCEAIVQDKPFIARGNGGSGLSILEPLFNMDIAALNSYAAYINKYVAWRFSYGRMVSIERIAKITVPNYAI